MKQNKTIFVSGLWHLGLVNAVCLADLGLNVIAYDEDQQKIEQLQKGNSTIFEPRLEELLRVNIKKRRLFFTSELACIKKASTILIAQDTPLDNHDLVDLQPIFNFVRKISRLIPDRSLVIVTSQVPVGTTEKIGELLKNKSVEMAYVPENLRLGKAVARFFKPDMIVIGAQNKYVFNLVKKLYENIPSPKFFTDIKSAEMVKHAINSFLGMSISYANELGNLSEKTGADFWEVAKIIKQDERIGKFARIFPGLGFAGGTLARDLRILQSFGIEFNSPTPLVDAILKVNEKQKQWVVAKLKELFANLTGKKIAILGLTYTANTSTLRRSLAVETILQLLKLKATVSTYDPRVDPLELKKYPEIRIIKSWKELLASADAVVVMTGWEDFKKLPWKEIKKIIKRPIILDPNNFLAEQNLEDLGFTYLIAGRSHEKT